MRKSVSTEYVGTGLDFGEHFVSRLNTEGRAFRPEAQYRGAQSSRPCPRNFFNRELKRLKEIIFLFIGLFLLDSLTIPVNLFFREL